MSTKKKMIKVLKAIIVICYFLAFISVAKYQVGWISFTRCIDDMVINALVVAFNWITIEILQAKRIR